MSASIAAIALPVAAAGALAAKTAGSVVQGFSSLLGGASSSSTTPQADALSAEELLKQKIEALQQRVARRIRSSGQATSGKVDVQLDEFGLLRASADGQESPDLSRWLSGETDLVEQFKEIQSLAGDSKPTLQVDLAAAL